MLLIVDEKAFKGPFQPILWSYGLKTPTWVHMAAVPSGICPTLPILSGFDPQQGRAQPPPAPRARPGREVEFETIGTRLPAEVQSLIEESCSFIPTKHKQAVLWWQTFQQLRGCRSERSRTSMLKAKKREGDVLVFANLLWQAPEWVWELTPKIYTSAMVLNRVPDNSCLGTAEKLFFYISSLFPTLIR